jgi:hypothetical protein
MVCTYYLVVSIDPTQFWLLWCLQQLVLRVANMSVFTTDVPIDLACLHAYRSTQVPGTVEEFSLKEA